MGCPVSTGSVSGNRTGAPVTADTSRARPIMLSASPRLGFTSTSSTTSPYSVRERDTEWRVGRQDQDAVRVGREVQLVARAQHAVADDAHLLGPLDAPVAGQHRARQRDRDALASGDVRRAADDLERLAIADRDARERQPVGARMGLDAEQLADDDVLPVGAPRLDALDLHPEQRQPFGQLLRRELDVDVVAQP